MKSFYEMSVLIESAQNEGIGNWVRGAALGASLLGNPAFSGLTSPASAAAVAPDEEKTTFVARVIFAEGVGTTPEGRKYIAAVIKNRIGKDAFGGEESAYDVVNADNAFECIDDPNNGNWNKSGHPESMNGQEKKIWAECLELAKNPPTVNGPSGKPLVYYHDHSISKPKSWDNKYYKAVEEKMNVPGMTFYSIVPTHPVKEKAAITTPAVHPPTHTVVKGDTLSAISKEMYGDPNKWSVIAKANPGINPNKLKIGTVLKIP